jgi:predicted nucleic acid-binding protein
VRRAVLADTGPLYAAVDPDDQHHERARREMERLAGDDADVLVLYPTVLEAFTLVRQRLGFRVGVRFLDEVLTSAAPVNPEPPDYVEAARRVRRYDDQLITLFDGVVASVSERLAIPVWTYDADFDVMRVTVWR